MKPEKIYRFKALILLFLILFPASLWGGAGLRGFLPFFFQSHRLYVNRLCYPSESLQAAIGGEKLLSTAEENYFVFELPLMVPPGSGITLSGCGPSFTLPLHADDLILGFVFFPDTCVTGKPVKIILSPTIPLSELAVTIDEKPAPLHRGKNNQRILYLLYPVLFSRSKSHVTVKAVSRDNQTVTQSFDISVRPGPYEKEEISLGAVFTGDDGLGDIRSYLLSYENKKVSRLLRKENLSSRRGYHDFELPLKGRVTSPFGRIRSYNGGRYAVYHKGLDIGGNPAGTAVFAPENGDVLCAEDFYARGMTVVLDHGLGVKSLFYHMDSLAVKPGDQIKKGALLGCVGTTGFSTGPHLHWEVRVNNIPADPVSFLQSKDSVRLSGFLLRYGEGLLY